MNKENCALMLVDEIILYYDVFRREIIKLVQTVHHSLFNPMLSIELKEKCSYLFRSPVVFFTCPVAICRSLIVTCCRSQCTIFS